MNSPKDIVTIFEEFGHEIRHELADQWPHFCRCCRKYYALWKKEVDIIKQIDHFWKECEYYSPINDYLKSYRKSLRNSHSRGVNQHKSEETTEVDPNNFVISKSILEFFHDPDQWLSKRQGAVK